LGCAVAVKFLAVKARVVAKPGSIANPLHVALPSHHCFARCTFSAGEAPPSFSSAATGPQAGGGGCLAPSDPQ
jgi:hypothetical protein